MKRSILSLLICLLLALPCWAGPEIFLGVKKAAGGGGTPTIIAQNTAQTSGRPFSDYTIGQSFTGAAYPLYSISLYLGSSATHTLHCRIGDNQNLGTTYLEDISVSVPNLFGVYSWVEALSISKPTLSVATYYMICVQDSGFDLYWGIDDGNGYAGGGYYYMSNSNTIYQVDSYITGRDATFKITVTE